MTIRWIPYAVDAAASNMAVDEAILEAHLVGQAPPTVRFYGWSPAAVSLGYAQKIDSRTIEKIKARGFDVVRRPTGGRAVLHQGDLTYSFVGSEQNLSSSVSASYLQICAGLLAGLRILGVNAEIGRGRRPYNKFKDCFQTTTSADLQVDGLKVVGSAQLRRKEAVLQHGSILLRQDQTLLSDLLSEHSKADLTRDTTLNGDHPFDRAKGFAEKFSHSGTLRHCNLYDLTGDISIFEIERAMVDGFEKSTGEKLERGELSRFESNLVASYIDRYAFTGLYEKV